MGVQNIKNLGSLAIIILTLEIPRGSIWPPSIFSNFLRNPLEFLVKKLGNPRGFNLWSFDGESKLGVDPTQSYGKIQKALAKIFILL